MTDHLDILRRTFETAPDGELVNMAAKRAMEQSVILQLQDVPADTGIAMGIEFLLRETMPGEVPEGSEDPLLEAMRDELRSRIVNKFGNRGSQDG